MAITCHACGCGMKREERGPAHFWHCVSCGAHALTESTLRKIVPPRLWTDIWPAIRAAAVPGTKVCPSCGGAMEETRDLTEPDGVRLDFCTRCRIVWLDPKEFERMPKVPVTEPQRLSPEAAKLFAKALASEYDAREQMVFAPLVEVLQRVIRALGRSGPR